MWPILVFTTCLHCMVVIPVLSAPLGENPLCDPLNWPSNGWVHMPDTVLNATSTYGCNEGFWNNGSTYRTCQPNATWSGTEGRCEAVLCPVLLDPPNGRVLQADRSYQTVANVTCDEGYVYDRPDDNVLTCLGNNTWRGRIGNCEVVQCPLLPDPPHGRMGQTDRSYKARATVLCDEGYMYDQPDHLTRHCQGDNTWSIQHVGQCQEVPCPDLVEVANGILSATAGRYTDTVILQCLSGFTMDGPFQVNCMADGTWSAQLGTCKTAAENKSLFFLFFLLLIPFMAVPVAFIAWKYVPRWHDPRGNYMVLQEILHCSFVLQCTEMAATSKGLEPPSDIRVKKEVKEALKTKLGTTSDVTISLKCKPKLAYFIEIKSRTELEKTDVMEALKEMKIVTETEGTYQVKSKSVLVRDQWLDILAKQVMSKSHIPDRLSDKVIDLDTQYVKLRLIPKHEFEALQRGDMDYRPDRYQAGLAQFHSEDIQDEDLLKDGEFKKLIILRGRAGIGKSTLVQHLLRNWACGLWATHLKVMFLLNLRYVMNDTRKMTLSTFLTFHSVYATHDTTPGTDFDWFMENQQYVGLILDGVDEVQKFKQKWDDLTLDKHTCVEENPLTWCLLLLTRKCLLTSTLIVSSRPFAGLRLINPTMRVELMGLTPERVIEFVEKNVSSKRVEEVRQALQNNPILMSVSSITFYCAALCKVLGRDDVTTKDLRTYTQITAYIMERFLERSLKGQAIGELSLGFKAITDLAYKSLFNMDDPDVTQLTFHRKDLEDLGIEDIQVSQMCRAGLFLQTSIPDPERPGESLGQFIHLSIQEFLGAVGLLINQSPELVQQKMSEMLASGQSGMAQMFTYGVSFNGAHQNINNIISAVCKENNDGQMMQNGLKATILAAEGMSDLQALQIIHESQSEDLAAEYARHKMEDEVTYSDTPLTAVDINSLVFTLRHHDTLHKLWLARVNLDVPSVKAVAELVNQSQTLRKLSLVDHTIDEACLQTLEDTLTENTTIQTLDLGHGKMPIESGCASIRNILDRLKELQSFGLYPYNLNDDDVEDLLPHLDHFLHLKAVVFDSDHMTDVSVTKVAAYMKKDEKIQALQIGSKMTDAGAREMAAVLRVNTSIQKIWLLSNQMTDEGVRHITEALAENSFIKQLDLLSTRISDRGLHHIAVMLMTNKTLEDLRLYIQSLTEKGADHIFTALKVNDKFSLTLYLVDACSDQLEGKLEEHPRITLGDWTGK